MITNNKYNNYEYEYEYEYRCNRCRRSVVNSMG